MSSVTHANNHMLEYRKTVKSSVLRLSKNVLAHKYNRWFCNKSM